MTASACFCLGQLCLEQDSVAAEAARLGIMELALSALRVHRAEAAVCLRASVLLHNLCFDETRAIKAKQLGAPVLLQVAMKAHPSDEGVHEEASETLNRI